MIGEYISKQGRYVGEFINGKFDGYGTMFVDEGCFEGKEWRLELWQSLE